MNRSKKILAIIMAAAMVQGALASTAVTASAASSASVFAANTEASQNGYTYIVSNSQATITKYSGTAVNIIIPSTLGGYKVAAIGKNAFSKCRNIKKLEIPNTVKSIGNNAFSYCTALKSVTIPEGVTTIGAKAFRECTMLKKVTIPSTVTSIGTETFGYYTFYNGLIKEYQNLKIPNFVIYGKSGSEAESYAKSNGLSFKMSSKVTLNKTSITLGKGESYTLAATVTPSSAGKCTWRSSNTSILTVTSEGRITAKSTGTATITATDKNGSYASCKVTIKNAPTSVSLNKTSITLGIGETYDLNSSLPSGCASYSVVYSSNNTGIVSVKAAGGLMTAKKVGTATITAKTFNGKTATCKVTVKKAPTSISLNKTSLTLKVGEKFDLNSSLPSGCASYSVVYSSNNSAVASVKAAGGLVTAVKKGTAIITAKTYNGKTAACKVTVK